MYKRIWMLVFAVMLFGLAGCGSTESVSQTGNTQNESFNKAKDLLLNKVYDNHRVTFYCGCPFTKNKKVRCKTGEGERATRIEWEHIVPASRFGQTFDSWKKYESMTCKLPAFIRKMLGLKCQRFSTRENAQRVSQAYRLMESDMYNLVPAIGLINQKRSNYPYGIVPGEERYFGACDFEMENGVAEPAPTIRGDIARTYFYMDAAYPGRNVILSSKERKMLQEWDRSDPVDAWECERCKKIEKLQGNTNPFVKNACQKSGM